MELFGRWFVAGGVIVLAVIAEVLLFIQRRRKISPYLVGWIGIVVVLCGNIRSPNILSWIGYAEPVQLPGISQYFPTAILRSNDIQSHNASAHGVGSAVRVMYTQPTLALYDTNRDALLGVTAHELGHAVWYHGVVIVLGLGLLMSLLIRGVSTLKYIGIRKILVISIGSLSILVCYCSLSRIIERQADQYALELGYGEGLVEYFQIVSAGYDGPKFDTYPERLFRLHDPLEERMILLSS